MTNNNYIGWDYPWFLSIQTIYAENKNPALLCNYVDEQRISVNLWLNVTLASILAT